jgi:DNA uptake protein ComE-like DNA-binding protein
MFGKSNRALAVFFAFSLAACMGFAQTSSAPPSGKKASTQSDTAKKTKKAPLVDINAASKEELSALPGIGDAYSQKIVDGRPYNSKRDLLTRKIVPQATYDQIQDKIIAHRTAGSEKKGKKSSAPTTTPK